MTTRPIRDASLHETVHGPVHIPVWNVVELCDEMALALWHAGRRRAAVGVLRITVHQLMGAWDPSNPRCREVFRKTRHVLNWVASWATDDELPSNEIPQPGMYVWSNAELRTRPGPMPLAILPLLLGRAIAGLDMRRLAVKETTRAAAVTYQEGTPWLRGFTAIARAALASSLGHFGEALAAILDAAKWKAAAAVISDRGEELISASVSQDEIWEDLPEEQKRRAQVNFLYLAFIPGLVYALKSRRDASYLDPWHGQLHRHTASLVDVPYTENVLAAAHAVLAPRGRDEIIAELSCVSAEDVTLRLVLNLALAESAGARLDEVVFAHASTLVHLMVWRGYASPAVRDFCAYIASYWRMVSAERSFRLRVPGPFRERVSRFPAAPSLKDACQLVLWCEEAVGTQLPPDYRGRLSASAVAP